MPLKTESALATLNERGKGVYEGCKQLPGAFGLLKEREGGAPRNNSQSALQHGVALCCNGEKMNPRSMECAPTAASCRLPLSGPAPAKRTPPVLPLSPWDSVLIQSLA